MESDYWGKSFLEQPIRWSRWTRLKAWYRGQSLPKTVLECNRAQVLSYSNRPVVSLRDAQDVDVNYYVLVPFETAAGAEWAAGCIGVNFDCHVVSRTAVDQEVLVVGEVT